MHQLSALQMALAALGISCAFTFPEYELREQGSTTTGSGGGAGGMGGAGGEHPPPFAVEGDPCSFGWECFSGNCLPNNTEPGNICCASACQDMGAASCGTNGKCDASGADCALYPAGTYCGEMTCSDGMITVRQCKAGSCTPSEPLPCAGGLACSSDGASCKEECASDDDCANPQGASPGPECVTDSCMERPPGAECDDDSQCASNRCGTTGKGHCCATSCGSSDEACAALDCDATGACAYPGADTPCGPQTCESYALRTPRCDGAGTCGVESTQVCPGHLRCESPTSCFLSCGSNDASGDLRCAPGHWCDGSTCHPAGWDELTSCLRDGQCKMNDCTPAGVCATEPTCDADGDNQKREDANCGGKDCDDSDKRVMDGQADFFDTPRVSGGYDFDCSGTEEGNRSTVCGPFCSGQRLDVPHGGGGCSVVGSIRPCFPAWLSCGYGSPSGTAMQLCH